MATKFLEVSASLLDDFNSAYRTDDADPQILYAASVEIRKTFTKLQDSKAGVRKTKDAMYELQEDLNSRGHTADAAGFSAEARGWWRASELLADSLIDLKEESYQAIEDSLV